MLKYKSYFSITIILICSFILGRGAAIFASTYLLSNTTTDYSKYTIVLDAGHGGMDPGKIGINNYFEKDINLAICLKLEKLLLNKGFNVIMTRTDDIDLSPTDSNNHKSDDLKKRVSIIEDNKADITISIHQNSFTDSSTHGPQTFFLTISEESEQLATLIQNNLDNSLDINESRGIKNNDDYYILKKSPTPTVIVECGFLSNPNEANLLITDSYQSKLARSIYSGICEYFNSNTI